MEIDLGQSLFFTDTAPTGIYTLSLHDALPIGSPPQPPATRRTRSAGLPTPSSPRTYWPPPRWLHTIPPAGDWPWTSAATCKHAETAPAAEPSPSSCSTAGGECSAPTIPTRLDR